MFDEAPPPVPPRQSTFDDGDVSPVHRYKKKWWFIFLNKKEKRQHVREACFLQLTDACDIRPQVLNSSFDSTSTDNTTRLSFIYEFVEHHLNIQYKSSLDRVWGQHAFCQTYKSSCTVCQKPLGNRQQFWFEDWQWHVTQEPCL